MPDENYNLGEFPGSSKRRNGTFGIQQTLAGSILKLKGKQLRMSWIGGLATPGASSHDG